MWNLTNAGHAPGRPEVDNYYFALQRSCIEACPLYGLDAQPGKRARRLWGNQFGFGGRRRGFGRTRLAEECLKLFGLASQSRETRQDFLVGVEDSVVRNGDSLK